MKRQSVYLAGLFILAAATIVPDGPYFFAGAAAEKSLAEQVVIRRDTFGVPHILAETEEAAAFAMGYARAEDHAVEIARRLLAGLRYEDARLECRIKPGVLKLYHATEDYYMSRFLTSSAFSSMNLRLGSTASPIRTVNISSVSTASFT